MSKLRWEYSEPEVRQAVDAWARGAEGCKAHVLSDTRRRRLIVLEAVPGEKLLVKLYKKVRRRNARRERWKRQLGLAPIDREWRALHALRDADIPAPEPVGQAILGQRKSVLVYRYLEGRSLRECLRLPAGERRIALRAVGQLVGRLHAAGHVHGDLHVGNILVRGDHAALLDVQRARRCLGFERLRELADLDFSLRLEGTSLADRVRFRRAALSVHPAVSDRVPGSLTRDVRRVGSLSLTRAHRYFRGRTRRCLRSGRLYARLRLAAGEGMRFAEFPEEAAREALKLHRRAVESGAAEGTEVLKSDHRSRITAVTLGERRVVVKEVIKSGALRRLADVFRGSPARRAWLGGHGLLARGLGAATPLAFVETRTLNVPTASAIVLQDLRPAGPVSEPVACLQDGQALADWLVQLALRLHRAHVFHGDLQALHVYARPAAEGPPEPALIDLEGVRFRRRLRDRERIQSLAELNASIADDRVSAAQRHAAFRRYHRALPFASGARTALEEIVRRSLARRHAWKGADCGEVEAAAPSGGEPVSPASR